MPEQLKDSSQVRAYYDERVPLLQGEYVSVRWDSSPVRREHYRQTRQALAAELGKHDLGRAVEVGCGPLVWTPLIRAQARSLLAADLSVAMLHSAPPAARALAQRCCADAGRLPLADASIDALCTIRAFEYFPDKAAVVGEFARVLRPGGYLMIVTKNRDYLGYRTRRGRGLTDADKRTLHSANITSADLAALARTHGFDDVVIRPVIVGRTNIRAAWMIARWLMRALRPAWKDAIPAWASGAVESFMITGRRAG